MKTKLLWVLILSVGSTALYFGIVRPEVPRDSKRVRDYLQMDPAMQPAVELPPLVVSESRLPAIPIEPKSASPLSPETDIPTRDQSTINSARTAPAP